MKEESKKTKEEPRKVCPISNKKPTATTIHSIQYLECKIILKGDRFTSAENFSIRFVAFLVVGDEIVEGEAVNLHLAAVSAYETGAAVPLTNVAKEIYRLAIREGRGSEDFSAIYDYLARSHDVQPMGNEHLNESHALPSQLRSTVDAHDV